MLKAIKKSAEGENVWLLGAKLRCPNLNGRELEEMESGLVVDPGRGPVGYVRM